MSSPSDSSDETQSPASELSEAIADPPPASNDTSARHGGESEASATREQRDAAADGMLEPPPEEVEGATPPGYDWPTHGGYLGCLVGALAACPIVGFIGANLWALFHLSRLALPLFVLLALASVTVVVAAARLGWALGRRFYRYYPQPQPTWGESDVAAAEIEARNAAKALDAAEPREERRPFIP